MAEMIMCTGRRVAHSDEPKELKTNHSSLHCSKRLFIKLYTILRSAFSKKKLRLTVTAAQWCLYLDSNLKWL